MWGDRDDIPDPTPPMTNERTLLMVGNCLTEAMVASFGDSESMRSTVQLVYDKPNTAA
jgi:hypothetical protein